MYKVVVFLPLLFSPLPPLDGAPHLSGVTHAGMRFAGELISISDSQILLREIHKTPSFTIGIPLHDIGQLSLPPMNPDGHINLTTVELLGPVLHLMDMPSLEGLVGGIEMATAGADWPNAFFWCGKLAGALPQGDLKRAIQLTKTWALFEMGLFKQARMELRALAACMDPLATPVRFCWLMARLEQHDGAIEKALAWARLPQLQIPRASGSLAEQLESLSLSLQSNHP